MNKTYSQALDTILKYIYEKEKGMGWTVRRDMDTFEGLRERMNNDGFNLSPYEYTKMIHFLDIEGYINILPRIGELPEVHTLTLKGINFITPEIGGFIQEREDFISEKNRRVSNEQRLTEGTESLAGWTHDLSHYTKLLFVSTALLVLVELVNVSFEIYHKLHPDEMGDKKEVRLKDIEPPPQPQLIQGDANKK